MKMSFTDEQIIGNPQHEAGAKGADPGRGHGMSEGSFRDRKARFGGMTVAEARRRTAIEDVNGTLKKLLAERMLDPAAIKDLVKDK